MGAGHDHGHAVAGQGVDEGLRRRIAIAFAITMVIVIAQATGAVVTGSLALLTDTAHAVADASGLLVAFIAATLVLRPASSKRTWGFRRIEVIAALGQSTLLLVVGTYAFVEGIKRLFEPPEVPATELLIFGVVGLVANIASILVLSSSRSANFNMRAAFLEVLNDALGSVGVIVAAIVMATTGYLQADAIAGLFIAVLIVPRAFRLMRETLSVLMEFTPQDLDLDDVRQHILAMDHVIDVHDLHASTVATGMPTISAHVVVDDECFRDGHAPEILHEIQKCVASHFALSVTHSTFQLETRHVSEHEAQDVRHA